jgi:hypothetical protein
MFSAAAVQGLYKKCRQRKQTSSGRSAFSNTDNMAIVGILSAQLLYDAMIASPRLPQPPPIAFTIDIDRTCNESHIGEAYNAATRG